MSYPFGGEKSPKSVRAPTRDAAYIFESAIKRPPEQQRRLIHYTTADGLIGILESGSLRATHFDFLNDSTECRSILSVLLPRIEGELREIVPKLIKRGLLDSAILSSSGAFYKKEAENMVRAMMKATNNTAPYFIASFCVHEADTPTYTHGLLSQWRGYARGGFAIEFGEEELDELNNEEQRTFRYQGLMTESVVYRDHESRVDQKDFAGFAGALLKNLFPNKAHELEDVLGTKVTEDFGRPFLTTAPFLKNPSFEEEKEYRIVALCNRPSVSEEGDGRSVKPIEFRARPSGEVVPFISLYSKLKKRLPIRSILVGPHHQQDSRVTALEILLEKHELKASIRVSEIPFRKISFTHPFPATP